MTSCLSRRGSRVRVPSIPPKVLKCDYQRFRAFFISVNRSILVAFSGLNCSDLRAFEGK